LSRKNSQSNRKETNKKQRRNDIKQGLLLQFSKPVKLILEYLKGEALALEMLGLPTSERVAFGQRDLDPQGAQLRLSDNEIFSRRALTCPLSRA